MAKSMSETFNKSNQVILEDSSSATSLPASESGVMHYEAPDGQTMFPFGQGAVLASRSVRAGNGEALTIRAISGPLGFGSSKSYALSSSLASRLRVKTDLLGSTLYRLTWKVRRTPSGRQIYALRASGLRTFGNGCTGWPTPKAQHSEGPRNPETVLAEIKRNNRGLAHRLDDAAALAGWNTPTAPSKTGNHQSGNNRFVTHVRKMAGWAMPTSRDWKETGGAMKGLPINSILGRQVQLADSGQTATGSGARTEDFAPLNPEHSRWLQGLPKEWSKCAATVIQSLARSPKRSSKQPLNAESVKPSWLKT